MTLIKRLFFLLTILTCSVATFAQSLDTEDLKIYPIEPNVWVHVTYLESVEWGRVACNGLLYRSGDEVMVFDTPITDEVSRQLISWIQETLHGDVIAVVLNHHHIDCQGGLDAFHEAGILSYGHPHENKLAMELHGTAPKQALDASGKDSLRIGEQVVITYNPGPAHTQGSLVSYLPETQTLFGGCQIKSLRAGKGNLDDADPTRWSQSVASIKSTFPDIKVVVPGHGKSGDTALLDYTIEMFQQE